MGASSNSNNQMIDLDKLMPMSATVTGTDHYSATKLTWKAIVLQRQYNQALMLLTAWQAALQIQWARAPQSGYRSA